MSNSDDNSNVKVNYRSQFTDYLSGQWRNPKVDKLTLGSVSLMNFFMVRNNVPMTQGHFEAASQSIDGGEHICRFLTNENKHVLDSSGNGCVYNGGKYLHHGIYHMRQPISKETEEFMNLSMSTPWD